MKIPKLNTNTTPNTTMMKRARLWQKSMHEILSILGINLEIKNNKT